MQDVNGGEMERSFVTTGRMVMMRSIGYKWDERKKEKEKKVVSRTQYLTAPVRYSYLQYYTIGENGSRRGGGGEI